MNGAVPVLAVNVNCPWPPLQIELPDKVPAGKEFSGQSYFATKISLLPLVLKLFVPEGEGLKSVFNDERVPVTYKLPELSASIL